MNHILRRCHVCQESHSDNTICDDISLAFEYGKHRDTAPKELIGVDDGYLIWVASQDTWKNEQQLDYIRENLLQKCIDKRLKKHPHRTLFWIKHNDPEYFSYLSSTNICSYFKYVR